jgi:hypothetical protein
MQPKIKFRMQYKKSFSRFADFYQTGNMLVNALLRQMEAGLTRAEDGIWTGASSVP